MEWFKHYNSAAESQSFELLIAEKDFETAYIYWWILEQISKFEDTSCAENRGKITLNFSYFKRKLGLNLQRTERVLLKIAKTFTLEIIVNSDKTIVVFAPKWLELQENRGSKNGLKTFEKTLKKRQDVRCKSIDLELRAKKPEFDLLKLQMSPDKHKFIDVLKKYDLEKSFKLKMPEVMFRFDTPEDLESFIVTVESSKKVQNILEQDDKQGARNYIAVSIKRESGILS